VLVVGLFPPAFKSFGSAELILRLTAAKHTVSVLQWFSKKFENRPVGDAFLDEHDFPEFSPIKKSTRTDGTKPNFEERMFFCLFPLAVVTTYSQTGSKFAASFSFDF